MGRFPRIHYYGAVYHVMARGVNGNDIFADDRDRSAFLADLTRIAAESSATVLAYCLMGNHFHLAIRAADVPLSSVMQRLLTRYSLHFNVRHGRTGHLFQARYKAVVCRDEAYLARLIRYIQMNPVRAGLVDDPRSWPWSSRVSGLGYDDGDFDPWPRDRFAGGLLRGEDRQRDSLEKIAASVTSRAGISERELRSDVRRRRVVAAKCRFVQAAINVGHPMAEIASWINAARCSVSRYARVKTEN